MKIYSDDLIKICRSEHYNFNFYKKNGYFERWGKTKEDNPQYAPFPEIVDMEISTICNGLGTPCKFCYKSNTGNGKYMSFETFKTIFHKLPKSIMQIAFGIGDIDANPDMWKIFDYCRENDYNKVVPNVTINGYNLTDEYASLLAKYCGAVAVSRYTPKDICYNAVKKLTDIGMTQVNIHQIISEETFNSCMEVMSDKLSDARLSKLNAIVLLSLKPKGRGSKFNSVNDIDKIKSLVNFAIDNKVSIGFDSCFAPVFLHAIKDREDYAKYEQLAEPCESSCFSCYIDVKGRYFPCSFCENASGVACIDLLKIDDFSKEVWNHDDVKCFREKLLKSGRKCPIYDIYGSIKN